jgi:hypothetical protein
VIFESIIFTKKQMTKMNLLKNRLIDKILVSGNLELLENIDKMLTETQNDNIYVLSSEEIELLMMSDQDIKYGNIISEEDLKKVDSQR